MLYAKEPEISQDTLSFLPFPSSSAVKYMVAVLTPAIPATSAIAPTLSTS